MAQRRRFGASRHTGRERTYGYARHASGEGVRWQGLGPADIRLAPPRHPRVPDPTDAQLEDYTRVKQERFQL